MRGGLSWGRHKRAGLAGFQAWGEAGQLAWEGTRDSYWQDPMARGRLWEADLRMAGATFPAIQQDE